MFDDEPYQPPEPDFNSREAQWQRFIANRVEIFLATLRPYDSVRVLWSFADLRRWKYKRTDGAF